MGSKRDKKKKTKESTAKNKHKEEEKSVKKQQKKRKQNQEEEEDIDAILEEFKRNQEAQYAITEENNSEFPSRRANAAFIANPINNNELILIGGEYYDGQKVYMYNDFYRYKIDKNEWIKITSPNSPGPRSSHQVCATPSGTLFLFGGEFVSPNETNFFHYKDFWSLDLKTNAWEKLELKTKPSPRSGHRMTLWKHFIILFGGFYDIGVDVRYHDDLWVFDTLEYTWTKLTPPEPKPSPRSGFQMFSYNDLVVLYGGYCKQTIKGQKAKGITHTDLWVLKLSTDLKQIRWERRKKSGFAPGSGCTMTSYKGKGIMFGGVTDLEESEEQLKSTCHGDMLQYNIDSNRWFPLTLRTKKPTETTTNTNTNEMPFPRFNTMMAVCKNTLFLFGGIHEEAMKELTLSDFWCLNLDKMNDWKCIVSDDLHKVEWLGEESGSDDDDSDEDGDEEDTDDESESSSENEKVNTEKDVEMEIEPQSEKIEENKELTPFTTENLREYFSRTQKIWEEIAHSKHGTTGKMLRRDAFTLAQVHYTELEPQLEELRKLQEEEEVEIKVKKMTLEKSDRLRR